MAVREVQMIQVEDTVAKVIKDILRLKCLESVQAKHLKDLGADEIDVVKICIALEELFYIEITPDEVEELQTAGDIAELIKSKM